MGNIFRVPFNSERARIILWLSSRAWNLLFTPPPNRNFIIISINSEEFEIDVSKFLMGLCLAAVFIFSGILARSIQDQKERMEPTTLALPEALRQLAICDVPENHFEPTAATLALSFEASCSRLLSQLQVEPRTRMTGRNRENHPRRNMNP